MLVIVPSPGYCIQYSGFLSRLVYESFAPLFVFKLCFLHCSFPLHSTAVCLLFATFLCLSCFPNSPPSHWVTSSKCHRPAQPFPSILFQPCHPDWCWFVPGWPDHTAALRAHVHMSGAIWGESITPHCPFSKKHWIFHLPLPHSPTSPLSLTTKLGLHFSFSGSCSSIKKWCCYPLSTKTVPKNFEFKGCHIWKLPYGKAFICLNTVTSLQQSLCSLSVGSVEIAL